LKTYITFIKLNKSQRKAGNQNPTSDDLKQYWLKTLRNTYLKIINNNKKFQHTFEILKI